MTGVPVIQTTDLRKSFGPAEAVRGVDLAINPQQITGFLGLNGAGKSTTIKMLLGVLRPDAGTGQILGKSITDPAASVLLRQKVAYVSESKQLYDYMTVDQMIRFTKSFYPNWRTEVERKLLRSYELPFDKRIRSLSKGMRTKLALLLAFARRPELLILDEPSEGLDPVGIEQMLENLVALCGEGTTVFFSSHQISEVERIADHVCVLHKGALVLDASLDEMRTSYRQIDLVFPILPEESAIRMSRVESVRIDGRQMRLVVSGDADLVVQRANELHATSIEVVAIGLRDIFMETVRES